MQSYFLGETGNYEKRLRDAQIPLTQFQIGRQKGIVFDDVHLPQALVALRSAVDQIDKSQYEGIQVLRLKRTRNGAAPAAPAIRATVNVETWSRESNDRVKRSFVSVAEEFSTTFGVSEIVLVDTRSGTDPRRVRNDAGKFHIFFWSSSAGESRSSHRNGSDTVDRLWEFTISQTPGRWRIWQPSGAGIVITDSAGTEVAELVDNNLYIHYPITSHDMAEGASVFRRILEEAALLRGLNPEEITKRRLELQRQRDEQARAEARANPVVVKRWRSPEHLQPKFVAVAKDFVQALGGKQIYLYDYCGDVEKHLPSTDGRVHICIWSSPNRLDGDGNMRQTVFGAPLKWDDNEAVLKPSSDKGVVLTDEDDNQVGQLIDDTLYIHYPLTKGYVNLKWDGKGPEALFRRILEEVVFVKTAAPEEKAARARALAEKRRVRSRKEYVEACNGRFDAMLDESRKAVKDNPQRVRELQQNIVRLIRETGEAQQRLQSMENSRAEAMAAYAKEFDKLLTIPKIVDVRVADNTIKVFTETLYCVNPRTKKRHEIGAFRIEMSLAGGVLWFNLTRRVNGHDHGMQAPHVWASGKACLGNMDEVIPQLIAKYEFAALAMIAIQFIESVNVDDPAGRHIGNWPVAA